MAMFCIVLVSLITGAVLLWLTAHSLIHDRKTPRWRLRHSFDLFCFGAGFICVIITSLYAAFRAF